MKNQILINIIILWAGSILAQSPVSQIEGFLEIFHNEDTTSIYAGKRAGMATDHSSRKFNTFIGTESGSSNLSGERNDYFGYKSGFNNTEGSYNSFFGNSTGFWNTEGGANSFYGYYTGFNNTIGSFNSFFGNNVGTSNTKGQNNTFVGFNAGLNNKSGDWNTFIGSRTGLLNKRGDNNTLIGAGAHLDTPSSDSLSYATAIGSSSEVSTDNTVVLGRPTDGVVSPGILVIGQNTPATHHNEVKLMVMDDNNPTLSIRASDNSTPKIQLTKDPINANSDWTIRMNVPGDDELQFRHHGNTRLEISSNGPVKINSLGAAGSTDICRNASNQISTCSSSIRYKKEVNDYNAGLEIINQLRPVSYLWKDSDNADVGFIAEEMAKIDERFITRNQKDQIEGVKYDRLTTILVNAIKEQQKEIQQLKKKLIHTNIRDSELESRIRTIESILKSDQTNN